MPERIRQEAPEVALSALAGQRPGRGYGFVVQLTIQVVPNLSITEPK